MKQNIEVFVKLMNCEGYNKIFKFIFTTTLWVFSALIIIDIKLIVYKLSCVLIILNNPNNFIQFKKMSINFRKFRR